MLITNGVVTRNISDERFAEYKTKGYEVVKQATSKPPKKSGDK